MRHFFLLILTLVIYSCSETQEEIFLKCGLGANPDNPPSLEKECLKPQPTLCPINPNHNYHHVMVLVDTTSAFPDGLSNYLNAKLFDRDLWSKETTPYTRVSLINLNDDLDPFERRPIISICRPPSGLIDTGFAADKVDNMNEGMGTKQQNYIKNFLLPVEMGIASLKGSEKANYTILFEQIRTITELGALSFREKDYATRSLHIVSDLMQNSAKFNFYQDCRKRNSCKDFKSIYEKGDYAVYFDSIKPLVDQNTKVYFHHIQIEKKPIDLRSKLQNIWTDYFVWAGVPKEQIFYNIIADFEG